MIAVPLVNLWSLMQTVEVESPFSNAGMGAAAGFQRLPEDPVGLATVTFSGVAAGVEIRVYDPDMIELAGIESCAENQVLSWSVYAAGSPKNNATIKIISTEYKIKDFPYTSVVGAQSIPVQMEPEPWYLNP